MTSNAIQNIFDDDYEETPALPVNPASVLRNPLLSKNLAVDIALRVSEESICEEYGLQHHELVSIIHDPQFVVELTAVQKALRDNSERFKLKCQMQSEHLLQESWNMIHNQEVSHSVRADLLKATVRWAGYERSGTAGGGGGEGSKFSVLIDLSNAQNEPRNITIEGKEGDQ